MRFFNTSGPVDPEDHYCLSPLGRFDLEHIELLIAQKKYFVLHAPRQTGKTSCMLALMRHLNSQGRYRCLYVNVEAAQAAREDVSQGMQVVLRQLANEMDLVFEDTTLHSRFDELLSQGAYGVALMMGLQIISSCSALPFVVLFDEVDSLVGDTLISFLRQIRTGYTRRPKHFPQSIILCGVRDVRDYRMHLEGDIITGGSAFNIKDESLRLGDFNQAETFELLQQHIDETGQNFEPGAMEEIWDATHGQPWLVNALAYEACFRMKSGRDRLKPITRRTVEAAREQLILRRVTHLDQLSDKLREERVRRVISPMIRGEAMAVMPDDFDYVLDLGLIRRDGQELVISNPIYREVIIRELTAMEQFNLAPLFKPSWYERADGSLDMVKLLAAFQEFFRENSEHWMERFQYKEAGPQLLMQAFLQRIINGGGRVDREYGLGRKRVDLLLRRPMTSSGKGVSEEERWQGPVQKVVIELKVLHRNLERTIEEGLAQTAEYMELCGADEGHLVVFNREEAVSWDEKVFQREESFKGKRIRVWGA